jgi:hypothetical protein
VIWNLSVEGIDDNTCEFKNWVRSSATPELMDFLGKQGTPWEIFKSARDRFQRLITGKRRLSSQEVSNIALRDKVILLVDARIQQI